MSDLSVLKKLVFEAEEHGIPDSYHNSRTFSSEAEVQQMVEEWKIYKAEQDKTKISQVDKEIKNWASGK